MAEDRSLPRRHVAESPTNDESPVPFLASASSESEAYSTPIPRLQAYMIGWICALQKEYQAACRMLDEEFTRPQLIGFSDNNTYAFGRIGLHYVVVGCLPMGRTGNNSAASVARDMVRSFPSLKFALMVGIGGGAPTKKRDIRLGDVVVGVPEGKQSGVVQYDFGKRLSNGYFERTGQLNSPPNALLGAVQEMERLHDDPNKLDRIADHMKRMDNMPKYQRPGQDRLYCADYEHRRANDNEENEENCSNCESNRLVQREERRSIREVEVHYGTIASGNSVMRDAEMRDRHAKDRELNVLCFEMEAAGVVNNLPCMTIRGICDYSDSHKNDNWQNYAALAAAAYARELLIVLNPQNVVVMPPWDAEMKRCM
jgi:nucleoside phosphorylase